MEVRRRGPTAAAAAEEEKKGAESAAAAARVAGRAAMDPSFTLASLDSPSDENGAAQLVVGTGRVQFRVCTLNCWALPFCWPIGSANRILRLERLSDQLINEQYDVVGLQELWSEADFIDLAARVATVYPYNHYFHSGFTGSGVCVLSKHPIVSTLMNRYSLNGFAHHIHRGDWFGGKVVGMAELEVGEMRVHFYSTHLHAEYNRQNDLYLPHRLAQCFELSQFVRHTSRGADLVILTGDMNLEPDDLGYRIILSNTHLIDAWRALHGFTPDTAVFANGMTCDRPDNCYTVKSMLEKLGDGKRLDYIMYKNGRMCAELVHCETTLNRIPGEDINFSDHIGVHATFEVDATERQMSTTWEHNRPLISDAILILDEGEARASSDRKLFIGLAIFFVLLIMGSLYVDAHYETIAPFLSVFRFFIALFIAFCLWYGFLGLKMEQKALKGAKHGMQKLLND
ncbi:hypothetical protein PRIPAC_85973 [Pristionchus pacificus]|uniref:sphingomyelin phosphodiesterase n=1 Tax=Pristionchus pacificus TaxID=54126 RepID=A0A2A6BTY3_PRIPA|nr:hypothetical protein PRIPAC_85973 [Pristionchus pacificus]|eukprot:PDM69211.1 hypothetical protein PRIPAC_47513 [Pristionchus pacificus]